MTKQPINTSVRERQRIERRERLAHDHERAAVLEGEAVRVLICGDRNWTDRAAIGRYVLTLPKGSR